jgi:hypothetical protein
LKPLGLSEIQTGAEKGKIRAVAEELNAHRKARQSEHPKLTLTQMYNVLEKVREGEPLDEDDERIKRDGLVLILRELHDTLDALVCSAYGWPVDISNDQIVERLVALNKGRVLEESSGKVRWLRSELTGVSNCPHCGISAPALMLVWSSGEPIPRADGRAPSRWSIYRCTSCGHLVTAKGNPAEGVGNPIIVAVFPPIWSPHNTLPQRVAHYLKQARSTLANADASVVMSASAIDAILKDHKLREGSLYKRIEQAVTEGLLTSRMAEWAHRVRLDANNPRHADEDVAPMSAEDAERAFDFAEALAEYMYVLPSRMPPK